MYSTKAVANYILDLADADGAAVSPLKLQKLLYYAHGWHLAITGEPLLIEPVEAWKYGPVVKSIYMDFKHFGNRPITSRSRRSFWMGSDQLRITPNLSNERGPKGEMARSVVNRTWREYSKFTPVQLSSMTHQPGTPWSEVWQDLVAATVDGDPPENTDIPNELIRRHFLQLAQDPQARGATA